MTAGSPCQFRENEYLELFDIADLPGITQQTARHCYALRVRGDAMLPFHMDGDILIVEKDSREKIRHGDLVVCHQEDGSCVKSLDLKDNIPHLRPLDLARSRESEQVTSLAQMDKIVFIISS